MGCRPDDKAARIQAAIDALYGRDNSGAVQEAFDLKSQLDYAGRHAELREELSPTLLKPDTSFKDLLTGDIADIAYRPDEILGDEVVTPVLEAYERYAAAVLDANKSKTQYNVDEQEKKLSADELYDLKHDAGLYDAIEDARDDISDRFRDDPVRLQYGLDWLKKEIEGGGRSHSIVDKGINWVNSNLNKNLLLNNLRTGLLNHTQTLTTTLPEYGFENTKKGRDLYKKAVKNNDPELDFIGGGRFYDTDSKLDKLDFFSRPEHYNQGVTYYAAKSEALSKGKSEAEAKQEGRKAIEKTQFKNRLGNRPRHYWTHGGSTHLSLLSYGIQMRRMHHNWWKQALSGKGETATKARKALIYYYGLNAMINGITADIPDEIAAGLKWLAPRFYNALRQGDRFSLMGALDADTAEVSRIPITPIGALSRVPVLWSKLADSGEAFSRVMSHPDSPKSWVKAFQQGALLLPPVPIIGNKNLGALTEWAYRSYFGDYERYTFHGKHYETDMVTETLRVIKGRSMTESQQAAELDAG